jgi:para-aminobenzoate synthetase component 1
MNKEIGTNSLSAEATRSRRGLGNSVPVSRLAVANPAAKLPVLEELTPAPDPLDTFRAMSSLPHVLFLDSALANVPLSRYSFVTADPFLVIESRRGHVRLSGQQESQKLADPFRVLAELLVCFAADTHSGSPPFQGGAAGLFGYDLCHHIEKLPRPKQDEFKVPDLHVGFYDVVVAFDHREDRAWLISTGFPELERRARRRRSRERAELFQRVLCERETQAETSFHRAHEFAQLRLQYDVHPLGCAGRETQVKKEIPHPACQSAVPGYSGLTSNFTRETYLDTVARVIEYIRAGDCFQVNLAQRLMAPADPSPIELYARLRHRNAAPFAGYYDLGDFVIASASPERFVRLINGDVETRPIKGTRPRGSTRESDQELICQLEASAKDRAENIMIVDLLRNDLGRVCRYGTVQVPAVCRVETFPYVHHLVSEVTGRLREGLGAVDLLRAAFPGGSVTGAPKIRAMEIIAELEPTARGPYCGSLGYIGFDGSMDTNILIRTITMGKGWMQFPVGGGIVADSIPEREYEETWHKAQGLLQGIAKNRPDRE